MFKSRKGWSQPLGATVYEDGVNFSIFSEKAAAIELLIFESHDLKQPTQIFALDKLNNNTFNFWHIFIEGLKPGWFYAYRVDGPQNIQEGLKFNRNKILIDPYSKAINDKLWSKQTAIDDSDNLDTSLRSMILNNKTYDWEGDHPLKKPENESIIYEMHVGSFTKSPTAGNKYPGKFKGVIEKIPYLKDLGITAVELLPIFKFDSKDPFPHNGLKNYWGYGTIAFFSPENSYFVEQTNPDCLNELKDMIKQLHKADIEVILDIVFGYTGEGNEGGPTISMKGLANNIYYMLAQDKNYYLDFSGCGNTLNCNHPLVVKFITDCLEYWVKEFHIDGFRFDEASILSRGEDGTPLARPPLPWAIELSQELAETKIIAEAWDAGGLYQVGYFPGYRWAEWNGRFRDEVRRFVRGDLGLAGSIASRISGSADIYQIKGGLPINSVNFVTSHDGFTMMDLVSYDQKHNEANGENNKDGINENYSCNYGAEGETDNEGIINFRKRQIKNLLTILLISRGIPMILSGDEIGRTQKGNNNAYCQDNETSWFNWDLLEKNNDLHRFVKLMIQLKKRNYNLHRKDFFCGETNKKGTPDISFHGCRINEPGWDNNSSRVLSLTFGAKSQETDIHVMMNMDEQELEFEVPKIENKKWFLFSDTSQNSPDDICEIGQEKPIESLQYRVKHKSIVILISK
jgi:glycogen operon protein